MDNKVTVGSGQLREASIDEEYHLTGGIACIVKAGEVLVNLFCATMLQSTLSSVTPFLQQIQ